MRILWWPVILYSFWITWIRDYSEEGSRQYEEKNLKNWVTWIWETGWPDYQEYQETWQVSVVRYVYYSTTQKFQDCDPKIWRKHHNFQGLSRSIFFFSRIFTKKFQDISRTIIFFLISSRFSKEFFISF